METAIKTKNCFWPFHTVTIMAHGLISPCCTEGVEGYGNIADPDAFCGDKYRRLRKGLLTGKLEDVCKNCRSAPPELVDSGGLREEICSYLSSKGIQCNWEDTEELAGQYAFEKCMISPTNRCNLRCIYCRQSGDLPDKIRNSEMSREQFIDVIDHLAAKGLKMVRIFASGEITVYKDWEFLCAEILDKYPYLDIGVLSNFAKVLSDDEIAMMARFSTVAVSCDTVNAETFKFLRGGKVENVLNNIERLLVYCEERNLKDPNLTFNSVVCDKNIFELRELGRYVLEHKMILRLNSLGIDPDSIVGKTGCIKRLTDLEDEEFLEAWRELASLGKRMAACHNSSRCVHDAVLYSQMQERAIALNHNEFLPDDAQWFYCGLAQKYQLNEKVYLRRVFLNFDSSLDGLFIAAGETVELEWSHTAPVFYRAVRINVREDENLEIGHTETDVIKDGVLRIHYDYDVLLELSDDGEFKEITKSFIRETIRSQDKERVIERCCSQPVLIWGVQPYINGLINSTSLRMRQDVTVLAHGDGDEIETIRAFEGAVIIATPDDVLDFVHELEAAGINRKVLIL